MKFSWLNKCGVLLLTTTLIACGGGGGDTPQGGTTNESGTGNETGENGGDTLLRGTASRGGPMANVEIVAIGANSDENANIIRGASTTSAADGSFSLDVSDLEYPIRLFATNKRAAESFALTSLVFEGQTTANINEITHAITQAIGSRRTIERWTQVEGLLITTLANYLPANAVNLDDVNNAIAQIRIAFVGSGILLESRSIPARQRVMDSQPGARPTQFTFDPVVENRSVDVTTLEKLVADFDAALAVQSNSPSKFDAVFHTDFVDPEGLSATEIAIGSTLTNIGVERYQILSCFLDNSDLQDRCLVRLVLRSNSFETLDFGNPDFENTEFTWNYDVIVERRSGVAGLKISGGQFKPFSIQTRLQHVAQTNVDAAGNLSSVNPIRTDAVVNVSTEDNNQNVMRALLQQTRSGTVETLLDLNKPGNGQCNGVMNLVRNPTGNADCSRQFTVTELFGFDRLSSSGLLNLQIQSSDRTAPYFFSPVRIRRGVSETQPTIPSLNVGSLRALHAYGTSMAPPTSLSLQLSPPVGFNLICIAADTEEATEPVCTRGTRSVEIPNNLLPAGLSSYVLYTLDNENHLFVRQYNLVAGQ